MAFDPFSFGTPFGENELSWDLGPNTNTSSIMTIPGDCENFQLTQVHLTPADGPASKAKGKRSRGTDPGGDRITVWNRTTKRKVSGNAAPMEKNQEMYLAKNPDCELYNGQDKLLTAEEKQALILEQNRIPIWNKLEQRKISGNAAPSEKNLAVFLRNRPHCEPYTGQDSTSGTSRTPARYLPTEVKKSTEPPAVKKSTEPSVLNEMFMDDNMAPPLWPWTWH